LRINQQPSYPNVAELEASLEKIRLLPGLVSLSSIETLRLQLAQASEGRLFFIQAGDCAERFLDCTEENVRSKLGMLEALGSSFSSNSGKDAVLIGRMAGQVY
jgi:3-deoxy-7-phosphoheptulonate synthase